MRAPSTVWRRNVLFQRPVKSKKAPATFFCLGQAAAADPADVAALRKNGFEVENHTWDHPTLTKLSEAGVKSEISRTTKQLGGAHYIRPPYGTYNSVVMAAVRSLGLRLVLWNVDTLDWKYRGVSSILHYVEVEVRPGAIILMHDGGGDRSQTVAATPVVVDWLRSHGYKLVLVKQLGAARPGTIKS